VTSPARPSASVSSGTHSVTGASRSSTGPPGPRPRAPPQRPGLSPPASRSRPRPAATGVRQHSSEAAPPPSPRPATTSTRPPRRRHQGSTRTTQGVAAGADLQGVLRQPQIQVKPHLPLAVDGVGFLLSLHRPRMTVWPAHHPGLRTARPGLDLIRSMPPPRGWTACSMHGRSAATVTMRAGT
jgi:hypothetical protein